VKPPRKSLATVTQTIVGCRVCPRLVRWREKVAREKVARFRGWEYWGKPVPGFGDPDARILVVGLAPGAHGANRTGRMFTGDRSGDFLYAALHRAGLASQPTSTSIDDGLELRGVYISAALRCVPPGNAPLPSELTACAHFLDDEIHLLPRVAVILALGAIAWRAVLDHVTRTGVALPRPRPTFAHGARFDLPAPPSAVAPKARVLIGSYHVSQQNTQTGKLTERMFDGVLGRAAALALRNPLLTVSSPASSKRKPPRAPTR
jgi:uracil-DNA glycosylase family 4